MANISALGGLARGLASSPLGNLSGLLMQKEQLKHNRKMAGIEEANAARAAQEAADAKQADIDKRTFLSEVGAALNSGEIDYKQAGNAALEAGLADLAPLLWKQGDVTVDNTHQENVLAQNKDEFNRTHSLASARQAHDQRVDNANLGLDERRVGIAEANSKSQIAINEAEAQADNINFWEGKAEEVRKRVAGYSYTVLDNGGDVGKINSRIKNDPKFQAAVQELVEAPENRVVRGIESIRDDNGDELFTVTLYNQKTNTVGPATKDGSASPDAEVEYYTREELMSVLAEKAGIKQGGGSGAGAGAGGGGKWKKHNETTLFNDSTGEFKERNLSLSESQDMYYESGLENIDKTFPTTAGMMGGLPEGSGDKNRLAKVLFGGLRGYNGLRSGAEAAVIDLVGRNDQDVKDAMNGDGEATERLLKRLLPPQKLKDVEKNTKEQFKEVVGAPPKTMPIKPGSELRKFAGGYQPSPTDMIFNPSP